MYDYKISVPVGNRILTDKTFPYLLKQLKRIKPDRVFTGARVTEDPILRKIVFEKTAGLIKTLKDNGYEVGVWMLSSVVNENKEAKKQVTDLGTKKTWGCHAGEGHIKTYEEYCAFIASAGADLIMFDDDYHNYHGGVKSEPGSGEEEHISVPGCFCDDHRKIFSRLHPELDFDEVKNKFWTDNEYKKAYLETLGEPLYEFARRVRVAVDKVNPNVRIGICGHPADYFINGIEPIKLAKILAGNTKPFMRLIGAPYWDYFSGYPDRLSSAIELERRQTEYLKNSDIEFFVEGDTFPRPRWTCSSANLECFDIAMRADGKAKGILKYMIDYVSRAGYETGYIDNHLDNQKLYEKVHEHFSKKTAIGARIYSFPEKVPESDPRYNKGCFTSSIIPTEGYVLSQLGIPTTYEGEGIAGVAFGENARWLTDKEFSKGIITDIVGARALTDKGIDVGLIRDDGESRPHRESYGDEIRHLTYGSDKSPHRIVVNEKAKVLSTYLYGAPLYAGHEVEDTSPASYLYENEKGQRFCVLAFDALVSVKAVPSLLEHFRTYAKTEQLISAIEWVSGKTFPVKCFGNPDLYMMCKEDETTLTVGLWNFSRDKIKVPFITLDRKYSKITPINCKGKLDKKNNTVTLSTLYPFEFCGFTLKK